MANNETLFWKVYRNKYIFSVIFNFVESEADHTDKLLEKRIKFKNLYKLEWFIENKQYQLLLCKLSNGEYIETSNQAMKSLLSINIKQEHDNGSTTMDSQLFKKILELLVLSNEKEWKLKQNQILLRCLKYSNLIVIDIVYQFYTGRTIETTVSELATEENEMYNLILKKIISNENNRDQLLKYTKIKSLPLQKLSNLTDLLSNSKFESVKYYISNFIRFKFFGSGDIDFKFQLYSINNNIIIDNQDLIESLNIYISIFNNEPLLQQCTNLDEEFIEKLLKDWIIISGSKALFKIYLSRYDRVINELMGYKEYQTIVMKYSFDNFSFKLLGSFKFTNKRLSEFRSNFDTNVSFILKNKTISNNQLNAIKFLKLYLFKLSNEITPKNEKESKKLFTTTISVLFNVVFAITSQELYNKLLNELPDQYKQHLPKEWNKAVLDIVKLKHSTVNSEMDEMFIVNDKETIHWIKECNILLKDAAHEFTIILKPVFSTVELAKYAHQLLSPSIDKRIDGIKYQKSDFYQYHIYKSIKECNINDIKSIHSASNLLSLTSQGSNLLKMEPLSTIKFKQQQQQTDNINYQDYNEILDFIKDNMVRDYTILQVIDFIVLNGYYEDYSGDNNRNEKPFFNLSKIKINLDTELPDGEGSKFWSQNLLLKFRDYNMSRFILENVFLTLGQNENIQYLTFYDTHRFKTICRNWSALSSVQIIGLIHLFINQVIKSREYIGTLSSSQAIPSLEIYYSYLNGLFLTLIDDKKDNGPPVTIEEVFEIIQLFNKHLIEFKLDNISKPLLVNVKSTQLYNYYKSTGSKYSKLSELSFETILKLPVTELTEIIIDRPYINNETYENAIINQQILNQNLQLFLNLTRFDLFLKELQQLVLNISTFKIKLKSDLSAQCSKLMDLETIGVLSNLNSKLTFAHDNQEFFIFMVLQCLKFGRLNSFKYLFKLLNLNNILNTDIDINNKINIYLLISKLEEYLKIETKNTKTKRNNFIVHNNEDDDF